MNINVILDGPLLKAIEIHKVKTNSVSVEATVQHIVEKAAEGLLKEQHRVFQRAKSLEDMAQDLPDPA